MSILSEKYTLANGVEIPKLGLGTWFIDDDKALWRLVRKTKELEVEFLVKDGSPRKAVFETGGLDGSQMPGWD